VQFTLDDLGIGKLLGPFAGGILDGAVGAIASTSDFIDNALVGAASPLINGLGAPIVHAVQNLGNLGKDLFSGDFSGAAAAAGELVTDIGNDLAKVGSEIVKVFVDPLGALEDAANVLDSIAQSIANSLNTVVDDIVSVADDIKDFFDNLF
jgi:hypothetical protein